MKGALSIKLVPLYTFKICPAVNAISNVKEEYQAEEVEKKVKEVKSKKSDLPDGYTISDDKEIIDKSGKVIGRIDVSYADITNDGLKDKITEYYLFQ